MARKSSTLGRRKAWDVLRLTLMWARKGGILRNRLVVSLNVFHKGIEKLGRRRWTRGGGALIYGDRELSFEETPLTRVKMCRRSSSMRFNIPCIKPNNDFEYEFEFDDDDGGEEDEVGVNYENEEEEEEEEEEEGDDEGIDLKAEQFIAKFYEQMKLQRQMSYLQKGSSL